MNPLREGPSTRKTERGPSVILSYSSYQRGELLKWKGSESSCKGRGAQSILRKIEPWFKKKTSLFAGRGGGSPEIVRMPSPQPPGEGVWEKDGQWLAGKTRSRFQPKSSRKVVFVSS